MSFSDELTDYLVERGQDIEKMSGLSTAIASVMNDLHEPVAHDTRSAAAYLSYLLERELVCRRPTSNKPSAQEVRA